MKATIAASISGGLMMLVFIVLTGCAYETSWAANPKSVDSARQQAAKCGWDDGQKIDLPKCRPGADAGNRNAALQVIVCGDMLYFIPSAKYMPLTSEDGCGIEAPAHPTGRRYNIKAGAISEGHGDSVDESHPAPGPRDIAPPPEPPPDALKEVAFIRDCAGCHGTHPRSGECGVVGR